MPNVDISASTGAFVGTVCLIAVRRSVSGRTECRVGELVRPVVSVHRLVLFLPDVYRLLDPSVHSVDFSVNDLFLIPIYDVVERLIIEFDIELVYFVKPMSIFKYHCYNSLSVLFVRLHACPIKHENPSNGLVCRRSEELKKWSKHSKVFDVFRVYGVQ